MHVSPMDPRSCTEEDLRTLHNQRVVIDEQRDEEDGFIIVKKKKTSKQTEGSPRVTRGHEKK